MATLLQATRSRAAGTVRGAVLTAVGVPVFALDRAAHQLNTRFDLNSTIELFRDHGERVVGVYRRQCDLAAARARSRVAPAARALADRAARVAPEPIERCVDAAVRMAEGLAEQLVPRGPRAARPAVAEP